MSFVAKAISTLVPEGGFYIHGDDLSTLVFNDESKRPTDEAIKAKAAEIEAAEPMRLLRAERDKRIAETDWWASADLTMTAEQTAYRQALRDITETYSSLDDVVWPTKPE